MPSLAECEVATGAASALARAARGELLVIAALPAAAESSAVATLLQRAQAAHPGRIVCKTGLAERGLHRLLGGADFVLSLDADGATGVSMRRAHSRPAPASCSRASTSTPSTAASRARSARFSCPASRRCAVA
jgi:hypothetical protein